MDNDVLILMGLVLGLGAVIWYIVGRKPSEPSITAAQPAPASSPVKPVKPQTVKAKLPTKAAQAKMTKAALETLGRDNGVELDTRMTKANMIADLAAKLKDKK